MKNLLLALILLFGFTAFSQGLTLNDTKPKPLKLENGKIYRNGIQIPSYEVSKILATDLHALKVYKQAKTKETLGATLLGLGVTLSVVDAAIGIFSDAKYPTVMTYVGVGMIAVSFPILSGRAKKVEEAVRSYNESLKNTSAVDFELNAVSNQNGVGIQIKF
ncbi:hypothetical protein [Flavobacterium wongokense]|uniref:hypothetical protein n=1 Tax=Flavobacterium wongokense TaxID=2910674 RepID=UPI001F3A0C41|nr:hypothetical protein [Flavobacterium sp. WG47]MCF6132145.1 hypothetical protein [Flavobacterium sp. WG47]